MKPKWLLRMLVSFAAIVVVAATSGLAQGFRTQQLLLDDDAGSLASRNTITLLAPSDASLSSDYFLRMPNGSNLGVGSMLFVEQTGATNDMSWLAAGTQDQILQIDATGVPTWNTINLIPDGTIDNTTLRWDVATSTWVENTGLTSDATGNTNIDGITITAPNIPGGAATEIDVVVRNASNELVVRTIDDLIGDATLSLNAVWVGDANNNPAELAAGVTDQVMQIDATGAPTWQTINLIPDGTVDNTTLRWDLATSAWVENTGLTSDASGNTNIDGGTITTPNIPAGAATEIDVVVRNASNELVVRTIDDLIGDATLSLNSIWVGDVNSNPAELAAGTTDQVMQIDATGAPTWQTINLIPDGTVDNTTLRWDLATSAWVENTGLTSDASGNTNIDGGTITTPNIPAGAATEIDVVVRNASNELVVRTIDDLIGDATLSLNSIWVGDVNSNPAELAAGTTDQVMQIDATGAPTWQTINLIPDGTVDNTTLRWDLATSSWVENTGLTSDATGNTNIDGATITTPNIPAGATADTDVVIRNAANELVVRPIDDLIGDATLSENAIWVGDVNDNPAEVAAGTTNQVLQIDAAGTPTWQTINLVYRGRIATAGTITQTINDANVTAASTILVQYEDPANGARIALDVTGRNAGTSFTVAFSALPAGSTFINYTIMP